MKKMKINNGRGDDSIHRLFFRLVEKGILVKQYYIKKPHVLYVNTNQGMKIIKKYRYENTINRNFQFIQALKQHGFNATINFEPFSDGEVVIKTRGEVWGIMPYLQTKSPVSYEQSHHRKRVIELLHSYHETAAFAWYDVKDIFPMYELTHVWQKRLASFIHHNKLIESIIGKRTYKVIEELCQNSLVTMHKYEHEGQKHQHTIIHGDTASHNFLRGVNNDYYLIDFDCAAQSTFFTDYIQLAQRFLLQEDFSIEKLLKEEGMSNLFHLPYFAAALRFPAMLLLPWYIRLTSISPSYKELIQLKQWTEKQAIKAELTNREILRIFPNI